jgi:hypothetical protein
MIDSMCSPSLLVVDIERLEAGDRAVIGGAVGTCSAGWAVRATSQQFGGGGLNQGADARVRGRD